MFIVDDNGSIFCHQGDSGYVFIDGLSPNKNYLVYFGVRNQKRQQVGQEVHIESNYQTSVKIFIPTELTDLLEVGKNDEYAEYHYGIKICDAETGEEDTLVLGNNEMGDKNVITVYPKEVEGTNGSSKSF